MTQSKQKYTRERTIESYLVRKVEQAGGLCLKYYNPGQRGYPDRICMMRDRQGAALSVWVEVKAPGRRPTPLQICRLAELRAQGQAACWISDESEVDELLGVFRSYPATELPSVVSSCFRGR
ncbi:MAG: hypothetical protein K2H47_08675 [Muribaculaceae bacterium]|nr:hypothetical protein [Muribaculaceae bacterium]